MKYNKKISILFFSIIFLISACQTSTIKTKDIDVRVGFSGLITEFLKNTPPPKVFEDDILPVAVKIKNGGAYSIINNEAILALGVEKDYTKKIELLSTGSVMNDIGKSAKFNLEGKSQLNPNGEELLISYNVFAGKVDPQSEFHTSTVTANLCYPYETIFSSTICVDTDTSGLRPGKKVCSVQDLAPAAGQGGPIAVTKVEISMLPTEIGQNSQARRIRPQFLILIENKGPGTPVKKDSTRDFCARTETPNVNFNENLNRIKVSAFLSTQELYCTPKEKIEGVESEENHAMAKLKDKKELIRCTLNEGLDATQDSYLSPFTITLTYGYTQSISASYLIQKAAR